MTISVNNKYKINQTKYLKQGEITLSPFISEYKLSGVAVEYVKTLRIIQIQTIINMYRVN